MSNWQIPMLPKIFSTCIPRDEIIAGELSLDLFAAKLLSVVEGKAPQVYQNANTFFSNTFPTEGLRSLIREVFGRLVGKSVGSPVIRLETSFGGGKTHDQIALWHICKQGRSIEGLDRFVSLDNIPDSTVAVAAIDGRDLDPENGIYHVDTGVTTYTLWGEIAYQIGGIAGYQLLQGSDKNGIAPGTSVLNRLIEGKPSVIILDEIACYLRKAKAKQVGKNSDAGKQLVAFFFSLMDLAAACNSLVFVYSLAGVTDTFAEETNELQELLRASARQERVLSPSTDVEIYNIVKQRLFTSVDSEAASKVASIYLSGYRTTKADIPDACKDASYAIAIEQSYPFHPELFNLLSKKIASIPNFQKTRGALRLLAIVVKYLWENKDKLDWISLIHCHHIPVGLDEEITNDLTTRLERSPMRPCIGADVYNSSGREAYAQVQDTEYLAAAKPPYSSWVARTIFLHSLTQGVSSGIHRSELNLSLFTPSLELGFVEIVLDKLLTVAWYLDNDPITTISRFREEPSINKIIAQEKEQIGRTIAKDELRQRRDSYFAKKFFNLVSAPENPADVDDTPNDVVLCSIDFDDATINEPKAPPPSSIEKIFNNTGESGKFRIYRNRLLFLVPDRQQLERAIDLVREYKAINNILSNQTRLEDLSESQQKELSKRKGIKDLEVRVALTNTYRHLFYPVQDPVKAPLGLMHYVLPAEDTGSIKGKNNQQEVILKALEDCQKIRSLADVNKTKPFAPIYILQKVWPSGLDSLSTKSLRDTFAKNLALNILLEGEMSLLRETIRQGLQNGNWDLKIDNRLFIKTDENLTLPDRIEFSDDMILYQRGILKPPAPKEIELNAVATGNNFIRVRWKAKGAFKVNLYQNANLVTDVNGESNRDFRPSDEYETTIDRDTIFKISIEYGDGEIITKETQVSLRSSAKEKEGIYQPQAIDEAPKFSPIIELDGSVDRVFTSFGDTCDDRKVIAIDSLEISVVDRLDYRKIGVALPQLSKLPLRIDQDVKIQNGEHFVKLEYQGAVRGFQTLFSTVNTLLNAPDTQADLYLKISVDIPSSIAPKGEEITAIEQVLKRNQIERISLKAIVKQ